METEKEKKIDELLKASREDKEELLTALIKRATDELLNRIFEYTLRAIS